MAPGGLHHRQGNAALWAEYLRSAELNALASTGKNIHEQRHAPKSSAILFFTSHITPSDCGDAKRYVT